MWTWKSPWRCSLPWGKTLAFGRELRTAAAVMWYERRMVSQGRASEIAGLSRADFLEALSRYGFSPFQCDEEELIREAGS